MYKKASKLKLRFATNVGPLTVEQLWDLKVTDLDAMAVSLEDVVKKSGKKSFLEKKTEENKIAKLQFDIVLDVLNTKVEIAEKASKAKETREHNQKILGLIKEKQEEGLKDMSIEELEKQLK